MLKQVKYYKADIYNLWRRYSMKEKRFKKVYTQGVGSIEIWVDIETGVNYLFRCSGGYAGGLTPLLDANGKVIVTKDI